MKIYLAPTPLRQGVADGANANTAYCDDVSGGVDADVFAGGCGAHAGYGILEHGAMVA